MADATHPDDLTADGGLPRLFLLELGVERPLDLALSPGRHELRDLGVVLDFDADGVRAAALGYGPSVFALPGVRVLRVGDLTRVEDGATISWAGRSWRLALHLLAGSERAPPRGLSLNSHGAGHPHDAVLLVIRGPERGNFFRVRSESTEWAPNCFVRGVIAADGVTLRIELRYNGDRRAELGGTGVAVPSTGAERADATLGWRAIADEEIVRSTDEQTTVTIFRPHPS